MAFCQYTTGSAGPAPEGVSPAIAQVLQKDGAKVSNAGAAYCSIWFRTDKPTGGKPAEENQTLTTLNPGTLLGVIRFDAKGQDRRGQGMKPGVYTLRYGLIPINGDHQGAAPQRDFVVMIPAALDTDLAAAPTRWFRRAEPALRPRPARRRHGNREGATTPTRRTTRRRHGG